MTRASWSIGSNAVNSKAVWLSKLACRRDEELDASEIEKHILSSNDSVELAFPIPENGKEVENIARTFNNRRKYSQVPSFPMCSIGCNRNDDGDETECSISDPKIIFSKDWTCHSDHETNTDFDNIQTINENDHSLDGNSKGKAHQSDNNKQMRTVNREVLSPTLHLLHEVYMKKLPSNTGVYFLSSNRHHPPDNNDFHSHLKAIETREDVNVVDIEQNKCDSVQMERMIFRQQLRYEAIRKELFDNVTPSPFDDKSEMGNSELNVRRKENNETDILIDTAGCQNISFWNYIPSMSSLLLNVLPENDALDDDSVDEGDLDEISYSVETTDGQSYFSYGTETNSGSAEDKYDYHIPYTANNQGSNFRNEDHEDPSYCGASMDQSHIYLMTTNARLEQARSMKRQQQHSESKSTSGSTIDAKKISELTLDDFSVNPHIQTDYLENEETKLPDFGWTRHFQPFWKHQLDIDIRQSLWLNAIHDSFKDQNGLLLDAESDQQLERRVAANEALQRIVQQRTQPGSFNHISTMVFDIWR